MRPSALTLGYHGCDLSVGSQLVDGKSQIKPSSNDYDWLGHGAYFWENNPSRALEWAKFLKKHPKPGRSVVESPCVVGAVIELGDCLDLTEAESLGLVRTAYESLERLFNAAGAPLPENKSTGFLDRDLILRNLDCAVINHLHEIRENNDASPFETVRGAFSEGGPLYKGAGIMERTHIQICVRNLVRIRGFFWPRDFKESNR